MVEGEVYVNVPAAVNPMVGGMLSMPGMNIGGLGGSREEGLIWREKTGEKTGLLFKSDEMRTLTIKGLRCTGCGLIEFYAGKKIET
jgi:hypothetical protein